MRFSALDACHRELNAKMTPFGGWEMPLSYASGTVSEHLTCRRDCVVFDVSHLGAVTVSGPAAFAALQTSLSNDLAKIAPGRAQYSHLLDVDGSVLDDVIVWWLQQDEFVVLPNASNTDRVLGRIGGRDITEDRCLVALQGPRSREMVRELWGDEVWTPKFTVRTAQLAGIECTVAGTGYTGESGIEISIPSQHAISLWNQILDAGISPAGLGARDTLRLEAALPLYGHELGPGITPLQADLEWVVAWSKPEFTGRAALEEEKRRGVERRLFGIATDGRRPPREGCRVLRGGTDIGVVTSGNFSPTLEHGIALALLDPHTTEGDAIEVMVRDVALAGRIVKRPFVAKS